MGLYAISHVLFNVECYYEVLFASAASLSRDNESLFWKFADSDSCGVKSSAYYQECEYEVDSNGVIWHWRRNHWLEGTVGVVAFRASRIVDMFRDTVLTLSCARGCSR